MSMAISGSESKIGSVVALAEKLDSVVKQSAAQGRSLDETERDVFSRVLNIGHAAVEQLLALQGAQKTPLFDKPERPGNRRMATLACVYSVEGHVRTPEEIVAALFRDDEGEKPKDRPRPQFKHVTARFPQRYEDADEVHESTGPIEAFCWADGQVASRRRDEQTVLRMMDGQKSLWETADLCLDTPAESTVDILDLLHAASYVWRAAKVFHTHFEHREAFTRDRLLRILQGNVRGVITGGRKMATSRGLAGAARKMQKAAEKVYVPAFLQRKAK
ncbi:MAG: hypothetical protein IH987_11710 [Planctomycetes bacterium]|nr:hypothetical protein [Planctomycetota bacterium]